MIYTRALKSSAVYSVSIFVPMAASFLLLPVYTRYLQPSQYGVVEVLETTRNLFALLVGGRFSEALFYFYNKAASDPEKRETIGTLFWGSLLVGISGSVLGVFVAPILNGLIFGASQPASYFYLTFAAFGLGMPVEAGVARLRAENRARTYVATSLLRMAIQIACTVTFVVVLKRGVVGVLWSSVFTSAILTAGFAVNFVAGGYRSFVWRLFRHMAAFCFPLGLSGIAVFFIHFGDRFFLMRYTTLDEVGLYSLAYKLGMLISSAQAAFYAYWTANMYELLDAADGRKVFERLYSYQLLALTYFGLLVVAFTSPVLRIAAAPAFFSCVPYVPWIALAYLVRSQGDYFRMVLWVERKVATDAIVNWVGGIFCLCAYSVLIPSGGVRGAIASTFMTFALLLFVSYRLAGRLRPFSLEKRRLVLIAGPAIGLGAIAVGVRAGPLWLTGAVGVLIAVAYPVVVWFSGFPLESERLAVREVLGRYQRLCFRSAGDR